MTALSSVYDMIHSNDGFFKSDKQALYWLNRQIKGSIVLDSGSVYNNTWCIVAEFDESGVKSITKILKNKNVTMYDRDFHDEYIKEKESKALLLKKAKEKDDENKKQFAKYTRLCAIEKALSDRIYKRVSKGDMGNDTKILCARMNKIKQMSSDLYDIIFNIK